VLSSLGRATEILRVAGREFVSDQALRLAAALSYYAVFSLVPLLFLVVAIAGFVFDDPGAVEEVVSQVTSVAGSEVGDTIESLLETVRAQRGATLSVGIVLAAFSASGVLQQVQAVLGLIFHVPESRRRRGAKGWLVRRGIAVAMALGLALLVFTPIVAVAAVDGLVGLLPAALGWLGPVLRLIVPGVSALLLMAVVGLTFQTLTPVKIPWKAAIRGGASTAVIAAGGAFLMGLYLNRASTAGTLGALGGVAILLLFFFAMWAVYLFGAEVTKVYGDYLWHGDVVAPSVRGAPADRRPEVEAAGPADDGQPTLPRPGFLAGLAVGWLARSRRERREGRQS